MVVILVVQVMGQKDIMIGKVVSYGLAGIAVLLFLFGSYELVMYDAQENGFTTPKEGTFIVEDGNEGYRVYTKHTNCEEVQVEFYYDLFLMFVAFFELSTFLIFGLSFMVLFSNYY